MSIGLALLQADGRKASRIFRVVVVGLASSPPASIRASVARTPGPPALVTIASFGPPGRGCLASTSAMSKTCEIEFTRSTPTRRNAASSTSSLPAIEPVCDAAAFAAASVRPALITMIGLESATSRAAERNDRASPIVSM